MPKKELSHQFIKSLKAPDKPISFYDEVQGGLILRISKAGTKSFSYRYRFHGKSKRFKIGTFPGMSLSDARKKIHRLKAEIDKGNDPQNERDSNRRQEEPQKFEELVHLFKQRHLPKLKPSTQKTYTERIDGEMIPAFKGMYAKDLKRGVIMELLEEIAYDRNSPIQSNRVRAILSSIISFGVQRGEPEFNPVKTIKPLGKEVKRDRVLEEEELRKFWQELDGIAEPTQSLFKILLLLGQRLGETRRMRWEYLSGDVWTIPKELTKANRKHIVPLPGIALQLIEKLSNDSQYVFESPDKKGQPIKWVHTGFEQVARRAEIENIKIHDLRRTAATYMAELGTDRTILGKVLNHKGLAGDSQVTARYDRYGYMDEKRTALNRWNHKLQQIIEGEEIKIHKIG